MADPVRPQPGPQPVEERELRIVGKPFRRVDGRAKVTGRTQFADDLTFPRLAWIKLVRSTVPHGRIRAIDLSRAEQVAGVLGFLTGKDLPTTFGILLTALVPLGCVGAPDHTGQNVAAETPLCPSCGETLCAVLDLRGVISHVQHHT